MMEAGWIDWCVYRLTRSPVLAADDQRAAYDHVKLFGSPQRSAFGPEDVIRSERLNGRGLTSVSQPGNVQNDKMQNQDDDKDSEYMRSP
jgi:hypothetical protein